MKEIGKLALRALFIMIVANVLTMAFASAVLAELRWLAIVMTVLLLAALLYIAYLDGASNGRKDRMFQATMEKQEADRGVSPTEQERSRFFKPQKGFAAAYLAAAPGILLSLLMLFVPQGSTFYADMTPVVRLFLGMYLGLYEYVESLTPYIYLPLSLVLPTVYAFGYLSGPGLYEKMMKQIEESKRKRRRRRRKKTPAAGAEKK